MRVVVLLVALVLALPASAEPLETDAAIDLPITAAAAAIYLGLSLGADRQVVLDEPPASRPGGIDTLARLRLDEELSFASDVVVGTVLASALAASAWDGAGDRELGHRLLLFTETIVVAGALNETVKHAVRRPRPYTYEQREGTVDDDLSFYSGHTTLAAAASFFTARSLDLTGDLGTGGRLAAYGGAALVTATVGTLRVAAGKHFPSDVLVGAVVGAAVGWLVPELHRGGGAAGGSVGKDGATLTFAIPL